jgi:ribosome-associated translation inhibitor RaiA
MQTRITARRFDVSDGLRAHIENSIGKLDRIFDGIHDLHVILDRQDTNAGPPSGIIARLMPVHVWA